MKSRFLIEAEEDDLGIDPERYVQDLKPFDAKAVFSGLGLQPMSNMSDRRNTQRGKRIWTLDQPLQEDAAVYDTLCLYVYLYPRPAYFRLIWDLDFDGTFAVFNFPSTTNAKCAQALYAIMPAMFAFGDRISHNGDLGAQTVEDFFSMAVLTDEFSRARRAAEALGGGELNLDAACYPHLERFRV